MHRVRPRSSTRWVFELEKMRIGAQRQPTALSAVREMTVESGLRVTAQVAHLRPLIPSLCCPPFGVQPRGVNPNASSPSSMCPRGLSHSMFVHLTKTRRV